MKGKGALLNRAQLCQTLGSSKYEFDLWVTAGMPVAKKPAGPGDGYLVRVGDAVAWLVARAERRLEREEVDAERERGLLYREQRIRAELENARRRGELLPAAEVVAGWQAAIGRARALLLGVPPAAAANLVGLSARSASSSGGRSTTRSPSWPTPRSTSWRTMSRSRTLPPDERVGIRARQRWPMRPPRQRVAALRMIAMAVG
jgi:phage terminase Nu1 subunit (DNA packaging protein)